MSSRKPRKKLTNKQKKDAIEKIKKMDKNQLVASLMTEMESVDTKTKEAKLNETSMKTKDGKRIIYWIPGQGYVIKD